MSKKVLVELLSISQQIERLLESRFKAQGRGLREKLDSVAAAIPANVQKKIRFLATTRNLAMHGDLREAASKIRDARKAFNEVRLALDPSATRPSFWSRLFASFNLVGRIKRYMTPPPGTSFPQVQKIADRVEYLLARYYRAQGPNLHAKLSSVAPPLPEEVERKIRFIATIRNQAAHEDIRLADEKLDAIKKTFAEIRPTLDRGATLRKVGYAFFALLALAAAGYVAFQMLR